MAKYSMIKGGKQVGPAEVYAPPHTMSGKRVDATQSPQIKDPNTLSAVELRPSYPAQRVSTGNPGREYVKHDGIKIRGTGAATKGTKARGPMA